MRGLWCHGSGPSSQSSHFCISVPAHKVKQNCRNNWLCFYAIFVIIFLSLGRNNRQRVCFKLFSFIFLNTIWINYDILGQNEILLPWTTTEIAFATGFSSPYIGGFKTYFRLQVPHPKKTLDVKWKQQTWLLQKKKKGRKWPFTYATLTRKMWRKPPADKHNRAFNTWRDTYFPGGGELNKDRKLALLILLCLSDL